MQPIGENTVNTPAFLGKLWKMVNDPTTDHLICWSASGNSFVIQNQAQFWYELLPLYYKHNNMSSFVRQLNMYGFHKMSTVENGTMDADKDEIQFTHPYFQKNQPELLRNIKRKAATAKSNENCNKHDELTKVLSDVKQLRGRQSSVDNQLNAMKQENALLWREVAILRQKHLKQQKIVNKLIQFLITLVQPSRMTVGVKRGYPLMIHEGPNKKSKANSSKSNNSTEGPIIHELDTDIELTPNLYEEEPPLGEDNPVETKTDLINSPTTSTASHQTDLSSPLPLLVEGDNAEPVWDKPDFVAIDERSTSDDLDNELSDENLINTLENEVTPILTTSNNGKVFLNPTTQDTLLSNLIEQSNKTDSKKEENNTDIKTEPNSSQSTNLNTAIATRDNNFIDIIKSIPGTSDSYSEDLSSHIENTQSELEQLKDILNGYNSFVDANALLGELSKMQENYIDINELKMMKENFIDITELKVVQENYKCLQELNKIQQNRIDTNLFSVDSPEYNVVNDNKDIDADPLVSGSELTPYENNFDFNELFDDEIDLQDTVPVTIANPDSVINTPQVSNDEPVFPAVSKTDN